MRKHYIALVQAGPSAYGMSFPDFPSVVTATRAINAAVERAAKMLARHVEGRPLVFTIASGGRPTGSRARTRQRLR